MLKFTKYGKNGPSGNLGLKSLACANVNPKGLGDSKLTGQSSSVAATLSDPNSLGVSTRRSALTLGRLTQSKLTESHRDYAEKRDEPVKVLTDSRNRRREAQNLFDTSSLKIMPFENDHTPCRSNTEVHLRITKVSPEELMKMDSNYQKDTKNKKSEKCVHFSTTLDVHQSRKRGLTKHFPDYSERTHFSKPKKSIYENRPIEKVKIHVYNDDYFPKVQTLDRILNRKIYQ